jgi:hypothetical protein
MEARSRSIPGVQKTLAAAVALAMLTRLRAWKSSIRINPDHGAGTMGGMVMGRLWLHGILALGFGLSATALAQAQESVRSTPKDTNTYTRPAVPADTGARPQSAPNAAAPAGPVAPAATTNVMRVFDVIVSNTDTNLKNTDMIGGTEASVAVNPNNRNQITVSGFSSAWGGGNAALWNSTDGGQTWTKQLTIPVPPGVPSNATSFCPCDQTFDYSNNNVLFGTFLTGTFPPNPPNNNVYSGSTTNPASAASWAWWVVSGVAQMTNRAASSVTNADQPWLLYNRGTANAAFQNVYAAYDDFGVSPVGTRVSTSINQVPRSSPPISRPGTPEGEGSILAIGSLPTRAQAGCTASIRTAPPIAALTRRRSPTCSIVRPTRAAHGRSTGALPASR